MRFDDLPLVPGQPYPTVSPYRDISELLHDGWAAQGGAGAAVRLEPNRAEYQLRLVIGAQNRPLPADVLPPQIRPSSNTGRGVTVGDRSLILRLNMNGSVWLDGWSSSLAGLELWGDFSIPVGSAS